MYSLFYSLPVLRPCLEFIIFFVRKRSFFFGGTFGVFHPRIKMDLGCPIKNIFADISSSVSYGCSPPGDFTKTPIFVRLKKRLNILGLGGQRKNLWDPHF